MTTDSVAPSPSKRHYWQLPVFVLGVVAMAAAYQKYPPTPSAAPDHQSRQAAIAEALAVRPPAWDRVSTDVRELEASLDVSKTPEPMSRYLAGSWHVAAAEYGPTPEARNHWDTAARHFAAVEAGALPTADVARFLFRQAKVDAVLQRGKPVDVIAILQNAPPGEDTGDRGRYVYETVLRLPEPNPAMAKSALEEYVTGPGSARATPQSLATYKFKLGELYLNENNGADARKWLETATGSVAAPEVRAAALIHLGRIAVQDNNPTEAAERFTAALNVPNIPADHRGQLALICGQGLASVREPAKALAALLTAEKTAGPVGTAATIRAVELMMKQPAPGGVRSREVDRLEVVVASLPPGKEFANPNLTVDYFRSVFEATIRGCVTDGDIASATRAANLYERVSLPGRAKEVKADALMLLAGTLDRTGEAATRANKLLQDAALDYDGLAAQSATPQARMMFLGKAAQAMKMAGQADGARTRWSKLLEIPGLSADQVAMTRMDLAGLETDPARAAELLQKVVDGGGAAAYTARVNLAEVQLGRARTTLKSPTLSPGERLQAESLAAAGMTLLEQAAGVTQVSVTDRSAHEKSLYLLGETLMSRGKFTEAVDRLRTMTNLYPESPRNERAKLWLASCLLVEGTSAPGNPAKVDEAIKLLVPLTKSKDSFHRTQSNIRLARGQLATRNFQDAVTAATAAMEECKGTVDELIALSLAYNGYAEQKRLEQCRVIETRMKQVFGELPETAFTGNGAEYTRDYWKSNWFAWFEKQAKP